MKLKYGLEDNVPLQYGLLYALQHVIFFLTTAIVLPLMVGYALELSQDEIAGTVERTLVLCGIFSLIQTRFGHRFPIMDGPAGLWVGLFLLMANITNATGGDLALLRTNMEAGIMIAGAFVFLLVITGLLKKILGLFTSLINGIVILLMILQISPSLVKGMTGINSTNASVDFIDVGMFFFTVLIILLISTYAKGFINSIATFIGVIGGWIVTYALGLSKGYSISTSNLISIPDLFAWGMPTFDISVTITCIIAALVLLSIQYASINGMSDVLEVNINERDMMRSMSFHGIATILAGVFSSVPFLSFYSSVGVVKITGVAAKKPFYIASFFMIIMGLIEPIGAFFSTIPGSVGYAAALVIFAMISSQAVSELRAVNFTNRESMIFGISILIGVGVMFLPPTAFDNVNPIISGIFSNGLICGMIIAFIMEHLILKKGRSNNS